MKNNHAFVCKAILLIAVLIFFFANFSNAAEENQLKEVIKRVMPATVLVITYDADGKPMQQGSGFFISNTGAVITNYHVMSGAEKAAIKTPDGGIYNITNVIAEDVTSDLIKMQSDIGSNKVNFLTINKTTPEIGDKVVIIGSPVGLESTVSDGIVSAVREVPGFGKIIQTTAPISPGSSGSPVVNMKGEVVGVASAQMLEGQNLNFVVPAGKIIELTEKKKTIAIKENGKTKTQADDILSKAFFYYWKEDYKKALPFFQQYLKTNHESADVLFSAGHCYANLERYQEALQAFKQAILLEPDDAVAHYNLGNSYVYLGRQQEAIKAFKQAIRLNPDFAEAHCNLGLTYDNLGRYEEAIKAYKQAIKLKPDFAEAHNNLGATYGQLGRYEEAIQASKQAIRLNPDFAKAHACLGIIYRKLGLNQEAIQAYKQVIRLNPDYAEAHKALGFAYLNLGRFQEANQAYKQAIRLKPDLAEAHYGLGLTYAILGRQQEAIQAYKQAIRLKPDDARTHFVLGGYYLKTGDSGNALEEYKILKNLNAEWANRLFNMIYK